MMKKAAVYIFITAVIAVCIVPAAGMLIFGESQPAANEMLAQRPALTDDEGKFNKNITDDLTDYIADRFAFRQEFITAFAKIKAAVFSESSSEDVMLGSSDEEGSWLYYSRTKDDWLNRNVLSESSIKDIAVTLSLMQEYAESQGTEFVFTIAPNKNSVYPEFMPDIGTLSNDSGNIELLEAALKKYGVKYADLKSALISAKNVNDDGQPLYHRWDSHWTSRGAALGLKCIADALGIQADDWFNEKHSYERVHKGDLYEMLYPAGKELDFDAVFEKKFSFSYMNESVDSDGNVIFEDAGISYGEDGAPKYDSIRIDTILPGEMSDSSDNTNTGGSLLMFRDSFGNALYPFMADTFERATFSRQNPYRMDWLSSGEYKYCVVEIVERNIGDLLSKAPVMPAPLRDVKNADEIGKTVSESKINVDIAAELSLDMPGYVKVTGSYDRSVLDDDPEKAENGCAARIFINTGNNVYEASPVGNASDSSAGRFTAFIPEEALKGNEISVILSDISSVFLSDNVKLIY